LVADKGVKKISAGAKNDVHRNQVNPVAAQLLEHSADVFAASAAAPEPTAGWAMLDLERHSHRVLAQRVSITMEADVCVEALREAFAGYGAAQIVNTDQDSQFSGAAFIAVVVRIGARQSMGGTGTGSPFCRDRVNHPVRRAAALHRGNHRNTCDSGFFSDVHQHLSLSSPGRQLFKNPYFGEVVLVHCFATG
jgi:hypothetical protein